MDITISDKQMKPAVIHTNQFEDGVHQLTFTIADCRQGTIDLRDYKAYAVTSYNGVLDIAEVKYTVSGHTMTLTWDVSAWTLRQPGIIQFQIRFSSSEKDGTAVWYSYKGVLINRLSINADDYVSANYPTLLKQWIDRINQMSGSVEGGAAVVYMPVGQSIDVSERLAGKLYYQIENATTNEGRFEDHTGARLGEFNAKHVADPDFNTMLTHGEFFCVGLLDEDLHSPMTCTVAFLHVIDSGSANQQLQIFYGFANNEIRTFIRSVWNGGTAFGTWRELVTDAQLALKQDKNVGEYNMVLVTDSKGNIVASSTITTTELNALNGFVAGGGTVQAQIDAAKKVMVPNYANAVSLTPSPYTAPGNGYILLEVGRETYCTFTIGKVSLSMSTDWGGTGQMFPVAEGDVVEYSARSAYFIPCK